MTLSYSTLSCNMTPMSNRTFNTDNRYSPEASGATVPEFATAAYSARWIDQGDDVPAEILPDRQGFAYDDAIARDALIARLVAAGESIRIPTEIREITRLVVIDPFFTVAQRRSGGYVYCDAWTTA